MLGTIAAAVFLIWVLGIVVIAFMIQDYLQNKKDEPAIAQFLKVAEMRPVLSYAVLSIFVVFWPASALTALVHKKGSN